MKTNFIVSGLPNSVCIDGVEVEIRTGFRRGVQFFRLAENEKLNELLFVQSVNSMFYERDGVLPDTVLNNEFAAFEAAYQYLLEGQQLGIYEDLTRRKGKRPRLKTFDWDADTGLLIADFKREYNISLISDQLHWYEFSALFNGLSDTSLTVDAIGSRSTDKTSDMSKAEKKFIDAKKRRYALKSERRKGVSRAEDEAIWGD